MSIVMRDYNPSPEKVERDRRLFAKFYQIEGKYPDWTLMNNGELRAYLAQPRPHIRFMEELPARVFDRAIRGMTEEARQQFTNHALMSKYANSQEEREKPEFVLVLDEI